MEHETHRIGSESGEASSCSGDVEGREGDSGDRTHGFRNHFWRVLESVGWSCQAPEGRAARLVAMPWAVRNNRVFGVFAPTPAFSGTGSTLLVATWGARIRLPALNVYVMRAEVRPEVQEADMLDQVRLNNREIGSLNAVDFGVQPT
jgi:hypothetical protein